MLNIFSKKHMLMRLNSTKILIKDAEAKAKVLKWLIKRHGLPLSRNTKRKERIG
jgi:hypothetical protein